MRPGSVVVAVVALLLAGVTPADAAAPTWERWQDVVQGIFDVSGPRADGRLVVAGSGRLVLVARSGAVTPFAGGPGGYHDDPGTEAYLAVSPGLHVAAAGCDFARDDVFVLRLHSPMGVTRVAADGTAQPFAVVPGTDSLNGIAFDTTGRFGHRLLVTGPVRGHTAVVAVDCRGGTQVITSSAPVLEGGLAVAPAGFGAFGGTLVAPDELSGRLYAIDAEGGVRTIAESGLPTGGDIGVESIAFLPPGFARGGTLYYADRLTPGNPHPGTDNLLRLEGRWLTGAGLHDGDLVAATEGGATMIGVRCATSCSVVTVVGTSSSAHGEGHLAAVPATPAAARVRGTTASSSFPTPAIVAAIILLALAAALAALRLRRR